jgi:hypothetical protein
MGPSLIAMAIKEAGRQIVLPPSVQQTQQGSFTILDVIKVFFIYYFFN